MISVMWSRWSVSLRAESAFQSSWLILGAALLVRLLVWAVGLTNPESFSGGDTWQFWRLAGGMSAYVSAEGSLLELTLKRTPGYPAVLAPLRSLGLGLPAAALVNVGFGVAAVALTIALGRRALGATAGVVAGWWLALDPLHAVESSILLTEMVFSVVIVLAVLAAWKAFTVGRGGRIVWWTVSGFVLGVATLVRPISLYLPVLVVPLVAGGLARQIGWSRSVLAGLAFLVGFGVPVGSLVYRNAVVSGVPLVSTIQGTNLARYRAVGALVEGRGLTVQQARAEVDAIVVRRTPERAGAAQRSQIEEAVGVELILKEPLGYTVAAAKGLVRTLAGPGGAHLRSRVDALPQSRTIGHVLITLSGLSAIGAACLGLIGIFGRLQRSAWLPLALLGVPLAYFLIVGSGYEAYSRFRLPLLPLLFPLAAAGATDLVRNIRNLSIQVAPGR